MVYAINDPDGCVAEYLIHLSLARATGNKADANVAGVDNVGREGFGSLNRPA